ncbi:MAG: ATP-binding protein [Betaproteobacteria bacterium AqS2]|uniref:ATP-binding protein n=1 Tax=Candidatus Amphirhobacter heronislandensis TaxID=1732024 RepID=A0A930UDF3_9GAMM|nr:ATP-binding protein [Betaproteobacteria bacterium AqS2]
MSMKDSLMKKPGRNPFRLELAAPPHLAGRDEELKAIARAVGAIAKAPGERIESWNGMAYRPIQLHGPAGAGKTALLEAARQIAEGHGIHVVSLSSLPDLHPDGELSKGIVSVTDVEALPAYCRDLLAEIEELRKRPEGLGPISANQQWNVVRPSMEACAQRRPLAFLMDHATDYDIQSLRRFLLHYDWLFIGGCPLALVLAGTPEMFRTLDRTKVGLMDRTRDFNLAELTPAAAREALRRPFEEQGVKVRDKALDMMAGLTDDYPQFIQIVGHEVWEAWAAAGRDEVDVEDVSGAKAGIQQKRERFYQEICDRTKTEGLVEHARHVMELLDLNDGRVTRGTIMKSIASGFAEDGHGKAVDICYELLDLGFIWPKDHKVEAGIPGLFDYCTKNKPEIASPFAK